MLDLEAVLPLARIRAHTKTDDVMHVTDDQLRGYRSAAWELAEMFTGQVIGPARDISEALYLTPSDLGKRSKFYRLKHPAIDGVVTVSAGGGYRSIVSRPGSIEIELSQHVLTWLRPSCCESACPGHNAPTLMYRAGYACIDNIPEGIRLGMLKHIAWNLTNPGDMLATVLNKGRAAGQGVWGSNDPGLASGAFDVWRPYKATFVR